MALSDVTESSPPVVPHFTAGPTVATLFAGTCNVPLRIVASPATLRVSWTLSSAYGALYQAKVYENGILKNTSTNFNYDKIVSGYVEGDNDTMDADWTYRVDIVRISDSAVVASGSVNWQKSYGNCSGIV
jgi:hypothetical protein